jgi:hypothetical protein
VSLFIKFHRILRNSRSHTLKSSYEKGINLRIDKRDEKSLITLNGKLFYSRYVLRPNDKENLQRLVALEGIKSVAPLDCALQIAKLPFKMTLGMMLRVAYWAQNQCSYQAAEKIIADTYGLFINNETVRLVVCKA